MNRDTVGISVRTLMLIIFTQGSAGTNLAVLPYLPLPLWTTRIWYTVYAAVSGPEGSGCHCAHLSQLLHVLGEKSDSSMALSPFLSLPKFSPGVCLLLCLSLSFPLPLHSRSFSLIILQCQIQSESCNSQRTVFSRRQSQRSSLHE